VDLFGCEGVVIDFHFPGTEGGNEGRLPNIRCTANDDAGQDWVNFGEAFERFSRLAQPVKGRPNLTHYGGDAPVGFTPCFVHQVRAACANDFLGVLRGDTLDLTSSPLERREVFAIVIATHASVDHRHVEKRRLVKRRPRCHQFLEFCCDNIGSGLNHTGHLLSNTEDSVGVVHTVGGFLGPRKGLVEHFVLQQHRTQGAPRDLHAHSSCDARRLPFKKSSVGWRQPQAKARFKYAHGVRSNMAKKGGVDLPKWAKSMWEDMGSPELDGLAPVHNGDLLERRQGLRRDDLVEIYMNVQAFENPGDAFIRGRLISSGKSSLEILGEDGECHFISREIIVRVKLVAHTRPAYIDDKELLAYEREDMKRRSKLHEKVEKETTGNDDSHLWG
jgi:hypothetical protein